MLRALKRFFSPRDDEARMTDRATDQPTKMLEMDEPAAGAGALLAGAHHKSETETELEKAAGQPS